MFSVCFFTVIGSSLCLAQSSPQQTLAGMHVPDDWQVEVYAAEPLITNPTAIDVDTQGRVWVCEGQYYRGKAKSPPADCVKVLEDTNGDGVADKATVFADGLLVPMSVAVAGTQVYVGESPNLWVYEDKDGDLKADPGSKKALLTGFGGYNHDHGLHGLVLGPDHWLYMTHGDPGFDVTGPDGSHAAYRWGAMLRCQLDGTRLEAFAVNFRNPYEPAIDSFGNVWCSDNDNDGLKSTRICWIMDGGNYGWYGTPLDVRSPDGRYDPMNHWRAYIPGHVPPALLTGFGSPAGICFYENDLFGPSLQNALLHTDAGPREVRAYSREASGAGFTARQRTVITADDARFRPVDVCVAPDGTFYVADWYDEMIGGHEYENPNQGRIYHIKPKGVAFKRTDKPGPYTNHADAMAALASPNLATQFLARERLLAEGQQAVHALAKRARAGGALLAARSLWLLDRIGDAASVDAALKDPRPEFRAMGVRILRRHLPGGAGILPAAKGGRDARPPLLERILPLAGDSDAGVRREVLLALKPPLRKGGSGGVAQETNAALLDLIKAWDGQDRFYLEAIGIAAGDRGPALCDRLDLDKLPRLDQRTIKLVQILHPANAITLFARDLNDPDLTPSVADDLVDALGWMTEPEAMREVALAAGCKSLPPSARLLAIQRIWCRLHGDFRSLASSPQLQNSLRSALGEPELRHDAIGLIGEAKMTALAQPVADLLRSSSESVLQMAAVSALSRLDTPVARAALMEAATSLAAGQSGPALQARALHGLAHARAYAEVERLLVGSMLSDDTKRTLVEDVARNSDGCLFLLTMIDENKLAPALRKIAIPLGLRHADINVRQMFARFSSAASQPVTIAQLDPHKVLSLTGDAAHGHTLFVHAAAKCTTCHRVGSEGNDVGPELTVIGRKYGPEAMLDQILRPGAAVAPEFTPYLLESESHGFVVGFLLRKTDKEVEFKGTDGQRFTVSADDVQSLQKQPGTIMPDLLLETFKEQDVADLLAYLCSLKMQPQPIQAWLVAGPFPAQNHAGYDAVYPPEQKLDLSAHYALPGDGLATWQRYKAALVDNAYLVELDKLAPSGTGPAVSYLYTAVQSPSAQAAFFSIHCQAAVKLFLNGKAVFARHQHLHRGRKPLGIPVSLEPGANTVLLKVESVGGKDRLETQIETGEPVTFSVR